jgi:hypothetical protein
MAVDARRAAGIDPERRRLGHRVRRLGSADQKLAPCSRPGAGGAAPLAFDQDSR